MGLDRIVRGVRHRVRGRFHPSRRLVLVRNNSTPPIALPKPDARERPHLTVMRLVRRLPGRWARRRAGVCSLKEAQLTLDCADGWAGATHCGHLRRRIRHPTVGRADDLHLVTIQLWPP